MTGKDRKPLRRSYAVYQILRSHGFPMYRDRFASRAEAVAYVARMGGNTKDTWFKIKAQALGH